MRRAILSLTLPALLVAGASPAGAGGLDLRIGGFFPRGNETLFQDVRELYIVQNSDFYGVYGGIEYNQKILDNVEFARALRRLQPLGRHLLPRLRAPGRRRDPPDPEAVAGVPSASRSVSSRPASGRRSRPSSGAASTRSSTTTRSTGTSSTSSTPTLPILSDAFVSDGTAFGFHVLGGLRVYLNRDFAVVAEGRYQWATDEMGDDFAPNEPGLVNRIDLSGATFTVGLHVRF